MNCKPKQMALIVRALPVGMSRRACLLDQIGKRFVKVDSVVWHHDTVGAVWRLEEPFRCPFGACVHDHLPDMILMPIDQDAEANDAEADKPVEVMDPMTI